MCCVLSYMWQQNGEDSILRKPELDAFLATGNTAKKIYQDILFSRKIDQITNFIFGYSLMSRTQRCSLFN